MLKSTIYKITNQYLFVFVCTNKCLYITKPFITYQKPSTNMHFCQFFMDLEYASNFLSNVFIISDFINPKASLEFIKVLLTSS